MRWHDYRFWNGRICNGHRILDQKIISRKSIIRVMNLNKPIDFDAVQVLPIIDKKLIDLLKSLTPDEWQKQTVAKLWKVKDVVAHLLDGNIRILSMLRDGYSGERPNIQSYQDLVDYLNGLNADWVMAMRRVSPEMLI